MALPRGLVLLAALISGACSKEDAPEAPAPTETTSVPVPTATPTNPAPSPSKATCGDKPLPPCPLYGWMKTHASPAILAPDFDALVEALERIAAFAPADSGYRNWASIARDGADAARIESLDAVKAACRSCHQQYRAKYKQEMRDRPLAL
jgi:hypothetical protein